MDFPNESLSERRRQLTRKITARWRSRQSTDFSVCLINLAECTSRIKTLIGILIFLGLTMTFAVELECPYSIICPCGNNGENFSVCVPDAEVFYAEVCARLSKCESCEEGSNICSKCPEDFEGPLCTREKSKIRQKRQFSLPDRGPIQPSAGSVSTEGATSCPFLDASNLGSIDCVRTSSEQEVCTGKCWKGYHFPLLFTVEMILTCHRGIWTPHDSFPKCKRNPVRELLYCPDPGINANSVRQPRMPPSHFGFPQGSRLEHSCDPGYDLNGDRTLFCLISGKWSGDKPRCVAQSTTPKNPVHELIYCRDLGINANSVRQPRKPPSDFGFPQGSRIEYSCDPGYDLNGDRSLFCLISGEWSGNRPRCVAKSTTTNRRRKKKVCKGDNRVCTDFGGGYKCFNTACPLNYVRAENSVNVCRYIIQECPSNDMLCRNEIKIISYSCVTLKSNETIPKSGHMDIFVTNSLSLQDVKDEFNLLVKVLKTPTGVSPATRENFQLRRIAHNKYMVSLIKSLEGPQEIELDLMQKTFFDGEFLGNSIHKVFIFVSKL